MPSPKEHTNKLIDETSPYLLQHAHNPVEWYPWGDEAFEKAEAEDKPVLISIGYSACHWCHVMERESFEDEETARLMNENFVNIKVDMEERPDVDKIYMNFVQSTTGSGGWPLNVFVTPDKLPFYGGTYFPPEPRYRMPAFRQILLSVAEAWKTKREELLRSANDILGELRRTGALAGMTSGNLSPELADSAFNVLARSFDAVNGGFGGAPKFPPSMSLEFLLRYHRRTGNEKALEMVERTCLKMAHGGIFDQLGGGFHRYTVDAIWLTPHFEKMLYDNAQLTRVYLHLFQTTGDDFYKRIAVETLGYVRREMLDERGGFYSAQDADSEGVEGKYFVWTPEETGALLGEDDARIFNFYYDVSEDGNFEEKNILNVKNTLEETAEVFGIGAKDVVEILERSREKIFAAREKRVKPFRDEKVLTAWNGLMLAAFAEAAAVLDDEDYLGIAKENADFILENMQRDGYLLRSYKDGRAKLNAYLEDYANLADALVELFQVSGEIRYLRGAIDLTNILLDEFWDEDEGGFFFTGEGHEELIVRTKDFFDNASPSGNSVAVDVLLKLRHLTGDEKYERFAVALLRLLAAQIGRYPQAFGRALSALEFYLGTVKEIVIIGERGNELAKEVWKNYLPVKIVVPAEDSGAADLVPLLRDRTKIDGKPTVYVCENFACRFPVTSIEELRDQIK
ncbi:MAG: thioredoxin domain-containing protein [Pyrinomonadaceae bacterium]